MAHAPLLRSAQGAVAAPSSFSCTWNSSGSRAAWVDVAGELDLAAVPTFEKSLREAQAQAPIVVVDLRGLEFIDCAAQAVLVDGHRHARRTSRSLVLLRGSGQVDRVLTLTGLLEELEVVDLHLIGEGFSHA